MTQLSITFHYCTEGNPKEEGCYLVVVKQDPEIIYPETELDSQIKIPGSIFYSIAEWDGDEWRYIFYDCNLSSPEETETLHIIMWADRSFK